VVAMRRDLRSFLESTVQQIGTRKAGSSWKQVRSIRKD